MKYISWNRKEILTALSLSAAALLTGAAFIYRGGMSEPDSVVMAAGMARMVAGEPLSECMLYGRYLNPGIYFLFKLLSPVFVRSPGDTIQFLNIIGLLSFSLFAGLFYRLLRRRFDRTVAACCTLITYLTPVFWESGTYFHPVVPALALLTGAILLFDRISTSPGGICTFAMVTLLSAASAVMRNEVLLAAPALLAAAAFSTRPKRNISLVAIVTLISAIAFMLVTRAVSVEDQGGQAGFFERFSSWLSGSISLRGILRTIPWAVMATGTVTVLAASWGTLNRFRDRDTRVMIIPALLWAAPAAAWLLWPVPVLRHYFIAVPAIVFILAATILPGRSKRAVITITAIVITLNLGLPELLYRSYNSLRPNRAKEPHGTFFYRHSLVEDRIERYHLLQEKVSAFIEPGPAPGSRCAVIPVNWEIYGYTIYCLAGRAQLTGLENNAARGIDTHDFQMWGRSIRLLQSKRFDLDQISEEMLQELGNSAVPGCTVLLPDEILEKTAARLQAHTEISTY